MPSELAFAAEPKISRQFDRRYGRCDTTICSSNNEKIQLLFMDDYGPAGSDTSSADQPIRTLQKSDHESDFRLSADAVSKRHGSSFH